MDSSEVCSNLLNEHCLLTIARRAATLEERIGAPTPASSGSDIAANEHRFSAWKSAAARGSEQGFARRLEWDDWSHDIAISILGVELAQEIAPLPYLDFLRALEGGNWSPAETAEFITNHKKMAEQRPFIPFYLPFLKAARNSLMTSAGGALESAFVDAFESTLLEELSQLATAPLFDSFERFRKAQGTTPGAGSDACYMAFLDHLLNTGGAAEFFSEYSMLARLMSYSTTSMVTVICEIAARLRDDRQAIADRLFGGKDLGQLKTLSKPLSDRHCGGRRVYRLEFSSGARVIYKPKDIAHENAFGTFVGKLREDGLQHAPRTPVVLCRDGYGWLENIVQEHIASEEELETYYRCAGTLLALVYLLDGNDCHMENVIATAGSPVLIDVESLLQPRMPQKSSSGTFSLAAQRVRNSVLSTGLLPQWQTNRLGGYFDTSGYSGTGGYASAQTKRTWHSPNSDDMSFTDRNPIAAPAANLPIFEGKPQSADDHLGALVAGFSDACTFIVSHKERVAAHLQGMFDSPTRLIFRASTHYGQLLHQSLSPAALRLGIDRSILLENIFRVATDSADRPAYWQILKQEKQMLEQLDVPYFAMSTSSCDLALDGKVVCRNFLDCSGKDRIALRLEGFSESHVEEQIELIRSAFVTPDHMASLANVGKGADAIVAQVKPVHHDSLLASAEWIANSLAANSIRGRDGFATWMAPAYLQPDALNQRGVSYYLYSGCAGIVLFLAAAESVLMKGAYTELIDSAIRPIENILGSKDVVGLLEKEGIGGSSGLSSLAYALTCVARYLKDDRYIAIATALCEHITTERILSDRSLDIIGGSAGAVLSLLTLYGATCDGKILDIAITCGRHLCDQAVENADGSVAWRSVPDGLLLAGFSHGTAGMALALARLHAACGDPRFLELAWKAIQYERTVYDAEQRNWPAFLPRGRKRFISTWCHGAPGVALGRLGCLNLFPDEQRSGMLQELQIALDTTVATGITQIDHLCCGNFGRIDILFTAGRQLQDQRLKEIAMAGATLVLQRARENRAFSLATDPQRNACFQPGFFRGISGVGYALLRFAEPEQIPSAMLWEVPD
ncbi:MAG: type 2 lanthipeptide synthetase LanM family protein [Verrucomicrobia bacterium]|nr:type 2 lanthipeptide synthetase LanM family protein [Verrucomicrobiota bacterium]